MTPEEKARVKIDRWFEDAGWEVTDRDHYTPASTAVAIREGLLENNLEADYFGSSRKPGAYVKLSRREC